MPRLQPVVRLSMRYYSWEAHRHMCTRMQYMYPHVWPHRLTQTDTLSTCTNRKSINVIIMLPSLADQEEGLLVGNMYIHMYGVYVYKHMYSLATGLRALLRWAREKLGLHVIWVAPSPVVPLGSFPCLWR